MPGRLFLPSTRLLLPQIVDRLLPGSGSGPLRMEDQWILVPTRQAGRRLREALTREWRQRGGTALLGLEVHPPSILFQGASTDEVAHAFDWMTAWQELLTHRDPGSLPALMPQLTQHMDATVALAFGQRLQRLREELFEAGLDLSSVAVSHLLSSEQERWQDLAALEADYRKRLAEWGLKDPVDAKREALATFKLPDGVEKLILAAVPDPSPVALECLKRLDRSCRIEVWIHGEEDAEGFTPWGVPTAAWQHRSVGTVADPEDWLECLASPASVLDRMREVAADAPEQPDLGLGLLDPSLSKPLSAALETEDRSLYDPSPVPLRESPLVRLLHLLHQHRQRDDPESLRALWRHPALLRALAPEDPVGLLEAWEVYAAEFFPDCGRTVDQTLPAGPLRDAWETLRTWLKTTTATGCLSLFRDLTDGETLDPGLPEDRFRLRQIQKTADVLQEAVRREENGRGPGFGVLLQTLEKETVDPLRVEGTFTAEGWLELPYHPASRLLLIGLQEGNVPPPPPIDPILPLQLREDLGMKSDRDWLARDTYLFHTLLNSRDPGHVRVWVMKRARDGSPLMPSRVLFACDDNAFLPRAALCFSDPAPPPPTPPPVPESWFQPDRTTPREVQRLSVSKINTYLHCPTRFYFQVILGMEPRDDLTTEPDAAAFGTLLHRVLECVVKAGPCEQSEWDRRCDAACTAALRKMVGPADRMSLRVFDLSARKRLHAAGVVQRTLWEEGWTPIQFETTFTRTCNGTGIIGKVDRIDRHPEKGLRILDYKTSDSPVDPAKAHLGTPRPGRESIQLEVNGKTRQWSNLQLPLYRWLVSPDYPDDPLEVAYFQLPSAISDTGISTWDREPNLTARAETCLQTVVDLIRNGVWHPTTAAGSPWDPYAPLLLDGSDWVPQSQA